MIRFFAAHPTAANLLALGILALGLTALPNVKRETFPDIPPRDIEIRVVYPGATAEDVEDAVCRRIEDVVDGIDNLEEVRCDARENVGVAIAEMREGGDLDRFLNDVKTEVEAIDTFPDVAEAPIIRQLGIFDLVASVAVTGPMAPVDLKAYAEGMKDRLMALDTITQVSVSGFSDHQFRVEIPLTVLRRYGLSVAEIADTLAAQSINLPSGTIETTNTDVLIRFDDERRSPHALEDLVVIAAASGAEIQLGDIARVTERFELDEQESRFNDDRAVLLTVNKTDADDTLSVIDSVNTFLDKERRTAPAGMHFEVTQDIASIVRDRLTMLTENGLQGLVLVFLTMWLVFSFGFSFWVASALPICFLGTIFAMNVFGYSFDMITMVGLLIAVGLLVDDSIVIAENIASHFASGKPFLEATVDGINEVKTGVIASFLTTVCIFGSLMFLKGNIGIILRVMPAILILTLSVSLIEAFLILPHHLRHALKGQAKPKRAFRRRLETAIEWTREEVLGRTVDWAIRWRYLSTGIVFATLLASIAMLAGGVLKFQAFPDLDGDVVQARILLPQGTPLSRTRAVVGHIVDAVRNVNAEFKPRQPDGRDLVQNISVLYSENQDAHETGPHVATVNIDLLSAEIRDASIDAILTRWREVVGEVPDVIALKFTEPMIGPQGRAIDIRLLGNDLETLKSASLAMQSWLNSYRGVVDLSDDLRPGKPELVLRLRDGAKALGLTAQTIASQLRAAYYGKVAREIQVGDESIEIDVRLAELDQDSLADLAEFYVTTPGGDQVPIEAVTIVETGRGYARINRVNGTRAVTLQGDVDTRFANTSEIIADTRTKFLPRLQAQFPDIRVELEGQAKETEKTSASLKADFTMGLLGIYILLAFLFRSYIEPVIVMVAIPLSLVGVVWGHLAMGLTLSMPSMMGFASLAGVIVNNSILLVEFLKLGRKRGLSVTEAARSASRQRFRAILLTSVTTIMGMLPLLAERSLQAQVLIPLVTSLAFGLFAGTVLVLIAVPALYTVLDDFGLASKFGYEEETETILDQPAQ